VFSRFDTIPACDGRTATNQFVTRSSRHKPALYKATGRGPKFSGHADRVTTIVQKGR